MAYLGGGAGRRAPSSCIAVSVSLEVLESPCGRFGGQPETYEKWRRPSIISRRGQSAGSSLATPALWPALIVASSSLPPGATTARQRATSSAWMTPSERREPATWRGMRHAMRA